MTAHEPHEHHRNALSRLIDRLTGHAESFEPLEPFEPAVAPVDEELPARRDMAPMAATAELPAGAGAALIDCGTSRRPGFTHVFQVSDAADLIIGADGVARLTDILLGAGGIDRAEWEGAEAIHVNAPGAKWESLLADARAELRAELDE